MLLFLFNDFCQPNYLSIYQTDLHQICRVGRTTWLSMKDLELFFRSLKRRRHGDEFLLAYMVIYTANSYTYYY